MISVFSFCMDLSVIICTHDPRENYLTRVLNGLKSQTLPASEWELLLVDNASASPVSARIDLSWHPLARTICEAQLGLPHARLRGIRESNGQILVFIDDDNVLCPDYLAVALQTMRKNALLGVLGAGRILPEFEAPPTAEVIPFLNSLALRDEPRAHYSNETTHHTPALPYGGGLCVLRKFAQSYVDSCRIRTVATSLGRSGEDLLSGEDIDLALHACREGYLAGVIPELQLTHLIPSSRVDPNYLVRLAAGHAVANYHLARLWGWNSGDMQNPILKRLRYWKSKAKLKGLARRIFTAINQGTEQARRQWQENSASQCRVD